jgi:hypothetical protein
VGKLTFEVNLSFRQLFLESFNRLQRPKHHQVSSLIVCKDPDTINQGIKVA